jgi:hypothetical protein
MQLMAVAKVGLPNTTTVLIQSPVAGAAAGRSWIPTPMVTIMTGALRQRMAQGKGGEILTRDRNGEDTDPRDPRKLLKRLNTGHGEDDDGGDSNKDGSTCTVRRDGVQSDTDTEHTGSGDTGHEEPVRGGEEFPTDTASQHVTDISDGV